MANDTRTLTVSLKAEVANLKKGLQEAGTSVNKLESTMKTSAASMNKQFNSLSKSSSSMSKSINIALGSVAGYLSAGALKSGIQSFIQDAISLESAFASVLKTVDGTSQQLNDIRIELLNVSTQTGEAATSLYEAAGVAGQLGIETKNITSFTRAMSEMGVTTNMTSEEAAMGFSRWANITGLAEEKISNLTSAVVALGNDSGAMESDILDMSLRFAGAAKTVKATDAEIAALSATLREVGLETELGGSAMARIFRDVAQAVSTGNEKLDLFASLAGQTRTQFQKAFGSAATQSLLNVAEGFKKFRESGGDAFTLLEKMGFEEIRLSQAFQGLSSNVKNARENVKLATEAFSENTARMEEAQKRYQTTEYEIKKTLNTITALRSEMMGSFMDAIRENISGFRQLIEDVRTYNSLLSENGGIIGSAQKFGKAYLPFTKEGGGFGGGFGMLYQYYKQRAQVDREIAKEGAKTAPNVGNAIADAITPQAVEAGRKAGRMLTQAYGDAVGWIYGKSGSASIQELNVPSVQDVMSKGKDEAWAKAAKTLAEMLTPKQDDENIWGDIANGIIDIFKGDSKSALEDIYDVNKDITSEMSDQYDIAKQMTDVGEGRGYRTGEFVNFQGSITGGNRFMPNPETAAGVSMAARSTPGPGTGGVEGGESRGILQGILEATRATAMNTAQRQVATFA